MPRRTMWLNLLRAVLGVLVIIGAAISADVSAPTPFKSSDKAFYLSPAEISFVRPGLSLKILSAEVTTDGVIKTRFRITDPRGLPLDRDGVVTPGTVSTSFIAAYIPKGQRVYTAYTTRVQTSPINGRSATQAGTDSGGTYEKVAEGEYVYTFRTRAPANVDRNASHTIGAYATRDLNEFELGRQFSDTAFNFVPDGTAVKDVRDVVRTATCNQCHNPISAHGGPRQSMEVCILCHQPQTIDPDTGNSVDMTEMTHKIHLGSGLPSVQAGGKYQIIGNAQSLHDYSHIAFPGDVRSCTVCHQDSTQATQAKNYLQPSRNACGSCHDDVNFATGVGHATGLPQVSDNQCSNCHTVQGELEFDASIMGAHTIPRKANALPGTVFEIVKIDDGTAGKKPTVTFSVKDKKGNPILPSEMARLALVLAGPTTDYAQYWSEDAVRATGSTAGTYTYTFTQAIPSDAKGSYSIGIEGYRNQTLLAGTPKAVTVRDAGVNKTVSFSVDGSPVAERRKVVAIEKCNMCHVSLSLHGDNRNTIEQCVLCHNPNESDRTRRPATAGAPESVNFALMIHKIHTGNANAGEYTVYGFGGTPFDFTEAGYPGDRRDCQQCHVNSSEQLPLRETLIPVQDPRGLVKTLGPTTAACTSCHTGREALAHAIANTNAVGESCSACHGPNSEFSVNRVHAR